MADASDARYDTVAHVWAQALSSAFKKPLFQAGAIISLTILVYLPITKCGYIWDDDNYLTHNPTITSEQGLKQIWLEPGKTPQYYPLVFSSFFIEYRLWGPNPLGYHATNVLLHLLTALLLWRLLVALSVPGAWFAALLFSIHPIHVESVAWITERKNVLSGFFCLGSMFMYAWLTSGFKNHSLKLDLQKKMFYWISFFLFGCSILSKTVTVTMPAIVLLLLWWKKPKLTFEDVLMLLPFACLGFSLALTTVWMEKYVVGATGLTWNLTLVDRMMIAGRAFWFYMTKLIWPSPLIFSYPKWDIHANVLMMAFYPIGVVGVLAALFSFRKKIGRAPLVAYLSFFIMLIPALGFFNVYPMRFSYVADHFQYLASIAIITAISSAVYALAPPVDKIIGLVFVLFFSVLTWNQCKIYKDVKVLWADTLLKNPASVLANNNFGGLLLQENLPEKALPYFEKALQIDPNFERSLEGMGLALLSFERYDEAIVYLRKALQILPNEASFSLCLADAHMHRGNAWSANYYLRNALLKSPALANTENAAHVLLGIQDLQKNNRQK